MHNDFCGNPLKEGQKVIVVTGKYNEFHKRYVHSFTDKKVRLAGKMDGYSVSETLFPSQIAVYDWEGK